MSYSVLPDRTDIHTLKYVITHVFFPLQLPNGYDHSTHNNHAIAGAVASAAHFYQDHLGKAKVLSWHSITRMLDNLCATVQFESLDRSRTTTQLSSMDVGDVRAFLIRAQNAAVIFRKQADAVIFESFEVSPKAADVMNSQEKLICSYPGPAIEIPTAVFEDESFLQELVNFLAFMNDDILDAAPTSQKARSTVLETRDTTHPRYITELLTGILRSVGCPADVPRITKRVGDDVVWNNSKLPWRRSGLWLLIRVALQTSLEREVSLGHRTYKAFLLFFLCCLGSEEICADLPNGLLLAVSSKISRRLRKLGSFAPEWLSRIALQTCTRLRLILDGRWKQVQDAQRLSLSWNPSRLDLSRDIQLSLLESARYLRNTLANQAVHSPSVHFNPRHHHRGSLDDFLSSNGAFFEEAYRTEPHTTLYDVEYAIEKDIDAWVSRVANNDEACEKLEILASKYSSSAVKTYGSNPELLSIMLLTTVDLWIALDKIAVKENPMLADYSPEVPISLLEDLLLCKKGNLHRLRCAYQYLSRRHSSSKSGWSVFNPTVTTDSFAVRFFRSSLQLQCLKTQIEEEAQDDVDEKYVELEAANIQHAALGLLATMADHEFGINRRGKEYHSHRCQKCTYEKEMRKMEINIHEWPLPTQSLHAEVVVFELDCPVSFNMWRSVTFHLLVDLCRLSVTPETPYIQLHQYSALQPYFIQHPRSRITLASDTKPFVVTHYSKTSIPATRDRVCVKNGLSFYGFDSRTSIPVSEALLCHLDVGRYCTYQLQSGLYQNLQNYMDATSHTSNEIMADQVDCHKDLSIHEFIAFAHLRSGSLLQWLNILRELRGRSLSFHRPDVHFLLAKAVSQAGPLTNKGWTWHEEIRKPPFSYAFLEELERLLRDVEANWLEIVTMDTISLLLRRLLAASLTSAFSQKATELLRTMRTKVFSWMRELSDKLMKSPGDEEFRGLLRDAAAVCRSTFDVDPSIISKLLDTAEDINVLLSSAILIHHHTPADISSLSTYSQLLLDRDRRLSLVLENVVSDVIQADSGDRGIDLAVGWVWPDYRPGSKWIPLRNPDSRWLWTKTAATANQGSQVVHFNLLDGTLLVGGKSLGRLPSDLRCHPLYGRIFGKQVLEIVPSDLPGMDYVTRARIFDHQVYFSLKDGNLVIRAIATESSDIIELIPTEKVVGDLPAVLIEGHVHWLNLSTSIMEIRPLDNLWKSSPENWRVNCLLKRPLANKGHEFLVDIRSKTWDMVSNLLRPLDSPQNLIVFVSLVDSGQLSPPLQLSVSLPRYGLSFYMNEDGDLQSRNIRGMVYDRNQSIGTLFGLASRLVLRPKLTDDIYVEELVPRCILIPDGNISFRTDNHHVHVEIDTGGSTLQRVTYQTYRIDTDLGCLAGNSSLTSKLFCAYLHALTSGCGTDPLTGRLGTEEALSILRSANCWSSLRFSSRDTELLRLIALLSPSRTWYPKHLRCMQKVEWVDLPENSQYHELYVVCKGIKEHYERVMLFQEGQSNVFGDFPLHDDHLLERSARRAAYLFPVDNSDQPSASGVSCDVRYVARDVLGAASGEVRAYAAATAVCHRSADSMTHEDVVLDLFNSWTETISENPDLSLRYDRRWLAPDLPLIWLKTYELLRENDEGKWFQLLFSLPAMAYASPELKDLVPVFVAFGEDKIFRFEDPPEYGTYDLSKGFQPPATILRDYVFDCAYSFERSPEGDEPAIVGESQKKWRKRKVKMYNDRRNLDADITVQELLDAWPCHTPPPCPLNPDLYDVGKLTFNVKNLFAKCFQNFKLKEHFARVQALLNDLYPYVFPVPTVSYSFNPSQSPSLHIQWSRPMDKLFVTRPAPSLPVPGRLPKFTTDARNSSSVSKHDPLRQVLASVEGNITNDFQRRYVSALRDSADYCGGETSLGAQGTMVLPTAGSLEAHYAQCRVRYIEALGCLKQHLSPRNSFEHALEQSGQWPRITAHTLLRSLASSSPIALSDSWKGCLIKLALLALEQQRARRLLRLRLDGLHEDLWKELENGGCDSWSPEVHPDWLLIQLQSNFLIRRVQAEVANEMISPRSGSNTVMQLNMGEGKSSVIVPIVAVDLADGDQLVRVIVPKALTAQMFYLLVDRLGGLVNRRIYFIPFSRSLQVDYEKVVTLHKMMSECMRERGILVTQPEHTLSLRLVSVEKQLPGKHDAQLADRLLELQMWLHAHSRDILDESDDILHVRYQLVYTIGLQQHMEGFPERWTTTQQVLGLVHKHASSLQLLFPFGVEYECGPSRSFPHLRILYPDVGQQLVSWVVEDILNNALPNFSFGQLPPAVREAIRIFISRKHVPRKKIQLVQKYSQQTTLRGGLLLLRGLLTTGILLHAFKERRWRVDYGLAPSRTLLAVPYRAKDVPAQRAEFGHPDVAILLTCLSYYYGGLSEEQLRLSFEILVKQDDPTSDYELWVRDCPLPQYLQTLSGINTKSSEQWNTFLFPLFSRNRETINFYLCNIVFPKEAKEFPSKLSCSGWDLAEKKKNLVTGFSGTNDGQYLLPLHITQCDPDHQRGTNAKVLSYLLQPENNHYMCMVDENGDRRTTREFLKILVSKKPKIRALLDVGAQMLDLRNHELAEAWLDINADASAAIYFSEDDELTVRTRDGSTQLLLSSPFAQQLDQCVVYLDDAHTRGTDIKFPRGFRAAVTLGPKVTKDRLTQGCMRMRMLGQGHSIMFFAPLEVDRRIRAVAGKTQDPSDVIKTADVLRWVIHETCEEIQQRAPQWAQQGMVHAARYSAWTNFSRGQLDAGGLSNKWLQPEAKRLEDLYSPQSTPNSALLDTPDIHQRFFELGILSELGKVDVDEEQEREQEREVVHEVEREQQIERPRRMLPAIHLIHPDVVSFVETGVIPTNTTTFRPVFETLDATSAATDEAYVWSSSVLATADFQKTVRSSGNLDDYLRPVQWVVSAKRDGHIVVILSPYEVNKLIPYIRTSRNIHLHLYTPRVNKSMKSCDDLALYSIPKVSAGWTPPSLLMDQLNMFAGQLYLSDYEAYIRLCRFLCIYAKDLGDEDGIKVGCDGFISPSARPIHLLTLTDTFLSSPTNTLRTLMGLRRKGMRFSTTHVGKLINGRLLLEGDFEGL